MRMLAVFIGLSVLAGGVAQAQSAPVNLAESCHAEARRQTLSGEALVDFMKRCNDGQVPLKYFVPKATRADFDALLSGEAKVNANRAGAAD